MILQRQQKFEACQTDAGGALLFSIGAGGVLFLTREAPGGARGWQRRDLSSAQIRRAHPHGRCTDFASAQMAPAPGRPAAVHLAMVVSDGAGDHLYLSLSNPASDPAWSAAPVWTACPFHGGTPSARLAIAAVRIGAANDGLFIAVDLAAPPGAPAAPRTRYYIDTSQPGAPNWAAHNAPIDGATAIHASCLGRGRGGWKVDGVYLAGKLGDAARLIHSPLYHPFSPGLPTLSLQLALPDELAAETIAACRNEDNSSGLFATAKGALYFFSAANQFDGAVALQLLADPLFEDMRQLFAFAAGGCVRVWGLNGAGEVVTAGAEQTFAAEPERWSRPRVVLRGVNAISPCAGGDDAAGILFAQTPTRLLRVARSLATGAWIGQDIVLAPH
jgi:hypothetical protein